MSTLDPSAAPAAARARDQAHAILQERRFHPADVPRPLARPLHWLGRLLQDAFDAVARWLPGGSTTLWVLLAIAVLVVASLLTLRAVRRRSVREGERAAPAGRDGRADPAQLEREAEHAAREGDFELALRLRFRAGLGRLVARSLVAPRPSLTSAEVGRRLRSPAYDELSASFDQVVYGGRAARADDVELARRRWSAVLAEADHR